MDQQQRERARREADAMAELYKSNVIARRNAASAERALRQSVEHRALRTSVAVNVGLIVVNVVLAVRGVQIWHLLQRVGFEGWIHTIRTHLPWTRRVSRVFTWVTMPVRRAVRSVRVPLRQAALARAAAAERSALLSAEREAAARAARLPWRVLSRKVWSTVCFVDRRTGGLGSGMRGVVLSFLGGGSR